jgi:hypothetical protein
MNADRHREEQPVMNGATKPTDFSEQSSAAVAHDGPRWWHRHGHEVKLKDFIPRYKEMIIEGPSTWVRISQRRDPKHLWKVEWQIHHSPLTWAGGYTHFSIHALRFAFGVIETIDTDNPFYDSHSAHAGQIGEFIRIGSFLNIPGPGTGYDGDPNVSIWITEHMRQAARTLTSN